MKGSDAERPASFAESTARRRLGSWKEIANNLGKTVRTVQRWEEKQGLPVRRLVHDAGASVFAYQHEIDRWLLRRSLVVHDAQADREEKRAEVEAPGSPPTSGLPASDASEPDAVRAGRRPAWIWGVMTLIVVSACLGLWVLKPWAGPAPTAVPGGARAPLAPELLTTEAGVERFPALSPDGRQVAYTWNGKDDQVDLYVRLVGADGVLRLTDTPAIEESPAWSPDGDRIVFLRRTGVDRRQLVVVSALGGMERSLGTFKVPLTLDSSRNKYASVDWSPDGRTLVIPEGDGQPYHQWLTLVDITTGERTVLTDPPEGNRDMAPKFSPTGDRLVFTRSSGVRRGVVHVLDLDQPEPRPLPAAAQWNSDPVWTPDGRSVVFVSGRWPRTSLWRVDADGQSEPVLLVGAGDGGDDQPSIRVLDGGSGWRLVYARIALENDIWSIDLASGEEHRLFGSSQRERLPEVLPDGRIAFISDRSGYREIWVVDASGENPQQWTDHRSSFITHPGISAKLGTLAYLAEIDGTLQAQLRDAPLGPPRPVFDEPGQDVDLVWSNDGQTLYVASRDRRDGQPATWAVRPGEPEPRVVTETMQKLLGEGPEARWLYMTEGSALEQRLLRAPVAGGEPEPVDLGDGQFHSFTLGPDGVYFLAVTPKNHQIRRWDWQSGEVETLRVLNQAPEFGMAITRDGRHALLSRIALLRGDLMQVSLDATAGPE